jgi:hypothetical protein
MPINIKIILNMPQHGLGDLHVGANPRPENPDPGCQGYEERGKIMSFKMRERHKFL